MARPRKEEDIIDGLIKKITVAGIGCVPAGDPNGKDLMDVYGFASGTYSEPYDPNNPDSPMWTCLTGEFEAVNLETGDRFRSGRLFLPVGQEMIERGIAELVKTGNATAVQIAFRIQSVKSSSKAGYAYRMQEIAKPADVVDPLTQLRKMIEGKRAAALAAGQQADGKALPAPEQPVPAAQQPAKQPARK